MILYTLKRHPSSSGSTLVEVLVAIALTAIMIPALATALVTAKAGRATTTQQVQANSLLREGAEAVRSVREKGWSNIATNGTYHPTISGSSWSLTAGSQAVNGFTRQVVINSVERNVAGAIVSSGGTVDPNTKHVVVTVSWTTPYANSVSTETYLTRWQNNSLWTQTTDAEFNGGTHTNTCASTSCNTNTNYQANGVQLQDTSPTWELPSVYGTYNISGNTDANDVFVSGNYAYVAYNNGLAIVNISNPSAPTLTGNFSYSANVNGVFVSGNYAYLATSNGNAQLVIVNISNPASPTQTSSLRIQDTQNVPARDVYVSGGTAVVVKDQVGRALLFNNYGEINTVDVSNPASPSWEDQLNPRADCNGVSISGNYAYVACATANAELTVVNISNPGSISNADTLDLNAQATDVAISGTTAYVTKVNHTGTNNGELVTVNISSPTNISVLNGAFEVGANTNGVSVSNGFAVLATAASNQAIIVNVSNPSSPSQTNALSLGATANRVFVLGNYAYYASTSDSQELQVVYSGHRPTGTFESSTLDAGTGGAGYNRLIYNATVPGNSTLQLQVAANNTGSGWSFVGPDGTAGTYFTATGPIPLQAASGRYFRYRAYFTPTSNGQQTPVLQDVSVNYSL